MSWALLWWASITLGAMLAGSLDSLSFDHAGFAMYRWKQSLVFPVGSNRLITCFLKQKLIIKTSNTPHQPSSTGHWCTLLGELGIVHQVLTKPIAKAKLRRWNWNQDCINLDTRRATKAGKTQENWPKKRRQRKRKWGGAPEVRYTWQVPWQVVVKWDWIRIWCVSEKLGKANNP